MHHHINHSWCSASNYDDKHYDATNIVDIDRTDYDQDDWDKLIDVKMIVSLEELEIQKQVKARMEEGGYEYPDLMEMSKRNCPFLKQEIIDWLDANIKPKDGEPGWAMGNDQYRIHQSYVLSLFFQRRNDAKKFIRTFSKYKKATSYFNYIDNPEKNLVLDIETGKYRNRH